MKKNRRYIRMAVILILILVPLSLYAITKLNNSDKYKSIMQVSSIEEVKNLIKEKDKFIIEFSKVDCPYCEKMDVITNDFELKGTIPFYKYTITQSNELREYAELKSFFSSFQYVPTLYYVENGEIIYDLLITDWDNAEKDFTKWVNKVHEKD